MNKNKKILIIGSGFASLGCCLKLIENKIKPTIVDYEFNHKKGLSLSNLFYQKKEFFNSSKLQGLGGLSSIWSGIVEKYTKKEINELNLKSKINFYNEKILRIIGAKIEKKNYNVLCLKSKKDKQILRLKKIFKNLIQDKKINYINFKVQKILNLKNKTKVKIFNKYIDYDYIFLCIGSKNISYLLGEVYTRNSKLLYSQKYLIPVFINENISKYNFNYPLAKYSLKAKDSCLIYAQVYSLSQILERLLRLSFFKKIHLLNKIGFIYLSANSKFSDFMIIKNKKIVKNEKIKIIKTLSKKLFNKNGFIKKFKYINFFFKLRPLVGSHIGGDLPMSKISRHGRVNYLCQPIKNKKISILGSSVFKNISATPPTLTTFYFSYYKTGEIIKKFL